MWRERVHERQLEMEVIPPGTELAPRNPGVRPWVDLSEVEQGFACRLQEAFAAFLDHTDAQVGRLLDALEAMGVGDDTLILALSDNGASQEGHETGLLDEFRHFNGLRENMDQVPDRLVDIGTRRSFTNYPWGWAQVGNTPGKRYKQNTHGGGVRDPLIVSWPNGTEPSVKGGLRNQFHHVIDLVPTVLELCGYAAPDSVKGVDQQPVEGVSLAYTLSAEAADTDVVPTRKDRQYFEMFGHRGIWADGWKAVTYQPPGTELDEDAWELYHLDEDFSECHDLAESMPDKLAEIVQLFWEEAGRYGVLPIETSPGRALFAGRPIPGTPRSRDHFVYHPPLQRIPADSCPALGSRSWRFRAWIDRGPDGADGVLLAQGTVNNGLVIYIQDGHLVYDHNYFTSHTVLRSPAPLPVGELLVGVDQQRVKRGPAGTRLWLADELVAEGAIPEVAAMISSVGMDIGTNPTGVAENYRRPFTFGGTINRIEIDTERALSPDHELALEIRTALGTQ